MSEKDNKLLIEITQHLRALDPPIKKLAVEPEDSAMTMMFVDLEKVCYITSRTDSERPGAMVATCEGKSFYNNLMMKKLED